MEGKFSQLRVNLVRLEDSRLENYDILPESTSRGKKGSKSLNIKLNKKKNNLENLLSNNYQGNNETNKSSKRYTHAFKLKILQKKKKKLKQAGNVELCKSSKKPKNKNNKSDSTKSTPCRTKNNIKYSNKTNISRINSSTALKARDHNNERISKCTKNSNLLHNIPIIRLKRLPKHALKTPIIRLERLPKHALSDQGPHQNNIHCKSCKCSTSSNTEILNENENCPGPQNNPSQTQSASSMAETRKGKIKELENVILPAQTEDIPDNTEGNKGQSSDDQHVIPLPDNRETIPDRSEEETNLVQSAQSSTPIDNSSQNQENAEINKDQGGEEQNLIPLLHREDLLDNRNAIGDESDEEKSSVQSSQNSTPIDYLCRDCGLEWELVCCNIPVDTFIDDLDEYRKNLRNGTLEKNYKKMYLTMLWLKATTVSDNSNTPEILTCVLPYEENNWAWEIRHLESDTSCQLLPCQPKESECQTQKVKEEKDQDDEDSWQTLCITESVASIWSRDLLEEIKEESVFSMYNQCDDDIEMRERRGENIEEAENTSTNEVANEISVIKEEQQCIEDSEPSNTLVECKQEFFYNNDSSFETSDQLNLLEEFPVEAQPCLMTEKNVLDRLPKGDLVISPNSEKYSATTAQDNNANVSLNTALDPHSEEITSLCIEKGPLEDYICLEEVELMDENLNFDDSNSASLANASNVKDHACNTNSVSENTSQNNYVSDNDINHLGNNCNIDNNNIDTDNSNLVEQCDKGLGQESCTNNEYTLRNKGVECEQVDKSDRSFILEQNSVSTTNKPSNIPMETEKTAQDRNPDATEVIIFTSDQLSVLSTQLLQHVQLLTTSALLCYNNPSLQYIQQGCHNYLEYVNEVIKENEVIKQIDNQVSCSEEALNTLMALNFVHEIRGKTQNNINQLNMDKEYSKKKRKKFEKLDLHEDIKSIILKSSAFPYPSLLPTCMFIQHVAKQVFLTSEDNLLALGLERHNFRDTEQLNRNVRSKYKIEAIKEIAKNCLPSKEPDQLFLRIKNLLARSTVHENNPIVHYLKTGNSNVPKAGCKEVPSCFPCSMSHFPGYMLPELWRQELQEQQRRISQSLVSTHNSSLKIGLPRLKQNVILPNSCSNAKQSYIIIIPQTSNSPLFLTPDTLLNLQNKGSFTTVSQDTCGQNQGYNNEKIERLNNKSSICLSKKLDDSKINVINKKSPLINMKSHKTRKDCANMNIKPVDNNDTEYFKCQIQTNTWKEITKLNNNAINASPNHNENVQDLSENVLELNSSSSIMHNPVSVDLNIVNISHNDPHNITSKENRNSGVGTKALQDEGATVNKTKENVSVLVENIIDDSTVVNNVLIESEINLLEEQNKQLQEQNKQIDEQNKQLKKKLLDRDKTHKNTPKLAFSFDVLSSTNDTHHGRTADLVKDISKDFSGRDEITYEDNFVGNDESIEKKIDIDELDFAINYDYLDTENVSTISDDTKQSFLPPETQCDPPQVKSNIKNGNSVSNIFVTVPVSSLNYLNSNVGQRRFVPIAPKPNIPENTASIVTTTTAAASDIHVDSINSFSTKNNSGNSKHFQNTLKLRSKRIYRRKKSSIKLRKPGYNDEEKNIVSKNERTPRKIKNPNKLVLNKKVVNKDKFSILAKMLLNKKQDSEITGTNSFKSNQTSHLSENLTTPKIQIKEKII